MYASLCDSSQLVHKTQLWINSFPIPSLRYIVVLRSRLWRPTGKCCKVVRDSVSRAQKSRLVVRTRGFSCRASGSWQETHESCLPEGQAGIQVFPSPGVSCCFYSQFCQEQFLHMDKQEQAKHLPWKECGQFQNCAESSQTLLHIYLGTLQRWMAT